MFKSLKLSVSIFGLGLALMPNASASYYKYWSEEMSRLQQAQPAQLPHQGVIVQQPAQPGLRVPVMQPPVVLAQQPRPASPVAPAAVEVHVERADVLAPAPQVPEASVEELAQGLAEETIESAEGLENFVEVIQDLVLRPAEVAHLHSARPVNEALQGTVEETIESSEDVVSYVEMAQDLIMRPAQVMHLQSEKPDNEVMEILNQVEIARNARKEARAARVAARALEEQNEVAARIEELARQMLADQRRARAAEREADAAMEAKKQAAIDLADKIRSRSSATEVAEVEEVAVEEEFSRSPMDELLEDFAAPVDNPNVAEDVQLLEGSEHAELDAKLKAILEENPLISSISSSVVSVADESQVNSLNASLLGSKENDADSLYSSVNFPAGVPNGLTKELNDQLLAAIVDNTPVEPVIAVNLPCDILEDYDRRDEKIDNFMSLTSRLDEDYEVYLYGFDSNGNRVYEANIVDYVGNESHYLHKALRDLRRENRLLEGDQKVKTLSFVASSKSK